MTYLFSFVTAAAITVSFRAPLRSIPAVGLTGLLGWAAYQLGLWLHAPLMLAVFFGGLAVGIAGEVLARWMHEPAVLFVIPGLFPLVPGVMAYNGMLLLAREELAAASQILTRTIFYAGSLAAGIALPPVIFRRLFSQTKQGYDEG